ncbi:MAG: hypothetical protein H6605_06090 [Flavobacteriales bacterium]|nr:hypothetical protein [Flavobacteriales bacterium]
MENKNQTSGSKKDLKSKDSENLSESLLDKLSDQEIKGEKIKGGGIVMNMYSDAGGGYAGGGS